LKGTYRIYSEGELIAEQENLLTIEGKFAILRFLAEQGGTIAGSICVGVGTTAAATTNTTLEFEVARGDVNVVSPDYANTAIVYKADLPIEMRVDIREIGMWTSKGDVENSGLVLGFDQDSELWSAGTWETTTRRIGPNGLSVAAAASGSTTTTLSDIFFSIDGMSPSDSFALAYNVANGFTASIQVRLMTDASNYYSYTIAAPTAGYKVTRFTKSQLNKTGNPTDITRVSIINTATAGGTSTVVLDGLRTDDGDFNDPGSVLLSRAILGSPVEKPAGVPFEIEYTLDVTL
jgi:hypothetical protein